jgi:quercetin 2,3-dioxygenase
MNQNQNSRGVEQQVQGRPVSDGAGVRLLRVLTGAWQRRLDPFLMLDEFRSDNPQDYIAGFPDHPHRGFETVTYMLAGRMRHRDNHGGEGLLTAGAVQWMTAGRGIVHSELPEQENGLMHGFQLWINLPAAEKMQPPAYQELPASAFPLVLVPGGQVKVIAGNFAGTQGPITAPATQPVYLDLVLRQGQTQWVEIPPGHNAFLYVVSGQVRVGQAEVPAQTMAILSNAVECPGVELQAVDDVQVLVLAGKPLNEPIAQMGPFVMNSRAELDQAVADYQAGRF